MFKNDAVFRYSYSFNGVTCLRNKLVPVNAYVTVAINSLSFTSFFFLSRHYRNKEKIKSSLMKTDEKPAHCYKALTLETQHHSVVKYSNLTGCALFSFNSTGGKLRYYMRVRVIFMSHV